MKKIYLGLLLSTLFTNLFAQADFEWAVGVSSSSYDETMAVVTDAQGNVYSTGKFYNTVDFDPGTNVANATSNGGADTFIQKLDASGNLIWIKTLGGGNSFDIGKCLNIDINGDILIGGRFLQGTGGPIDFNPDPNVIDTVTNSGRTFILKLDENGEFVWVKSFNNSSGQLIDLTTDHLGNIIAVGQLKDSADFDPGIGVHYLHAIGDYDAFVSKLDINGDFLWAHSFGDTTVYSTSSSGAGGVDTDDSGNIYVSGKFQGTPDFDPGPNVFNLSAGLNHEETFILKLDSTGNFVWAKCFDTSARSESASIVLDQSNNIILCGGYYGTADFDPGVGTFFINPNGVRNSFLVKLDNNGELIWAKSSEGSSSAYTYGRRVDIDSYGNIFIIGQFNDTVDFDYGIGTDYLYSEGQTDLFLQKVDASGNHLWALNIGGQGEQSGTSVHSDNFNNLYITGKYGDTTDFDPNPLAIYNLPFSGYTDGFLEKLSMCSPSTSTDVINTCDNSAYTWIDGVTYTSSNNTAVHTIIGGAANGCDSIVSLDLTFGGSTGTDVVHKCDSYTWIDGNTYVTSNNTATFTLTNAAGCDSIVTLDLTIGSSNTGTDTQESCGPFTWIDGITYTTDNNTATHTLSNASGCDSVVTLYLTVNDVNTNYTATNGTIIADASGATYQWIDCNTNAPITGETGQTYTPTTNGSYAVIVTENNCTDTSSCVSIENVGVAHQQLLNQITIYPNPTEELVVMELGELQDVTIAVFDVNGKLLFSKENINTTQFQFKLTEAPGVYFVEVNAQGGLQRFKLMKQ